MNKSFSAEEKVGIFVIIGLVILAYMSLKVGELRFGKRRGYSVAVNFTNAGGLNEDAAVRVAGVNVGKVLDITLKDSKAHISLLIDPGVFLEKDVRAMIKTAGVLGEKYVEIVPGKSKEYLSEGDEIISTVSPADLDNLMNQVSEIAEDIREITRSLKDSIGTQEGS